MIEIGSDTTPSNGVFQKDIAKNQNLSVKYLDHIISSLKASGLITTVRGRKSGYILTRPASEISMLDIHNAFENGICVIDCLDINFKCENDGVCKSQEFWKGLNVIVLDYFKATTLKDLIDR